jgi:transposase
MRTGDGTIAGHLLGRIAVEAGAIAPSRLSAQEQIAELVAQLDAVTKERDNWLRRCRELQAQLELIRRRLFVAKAERINSAQLLLEFDETRKKLEELGIVTEPDGSGDPLGLPDVTPPTSDGTDGGDGASGGTRRSTGRRDLAMVVVVREDVVELKDDALEIAVSNGRAKRIGFETSYRAARQAAGLVRIVVQRVKYRVSEPSGETHLDIAPKARELIGSTLAAPSLIAHILVSKYAMGLPFYRLEESLRAEGMALDRTTMCRYAEDVGSTLGAIVDAAARKVGALCLLDATRCAFSGNL